MNQVTTCCVFAARWLGTAFSWSRISTQVKIPKPSAIRCSSFCKTIGFGLIQQFLEKRRTIPRLQADKERFYKQAWYLHFKYVAQCAVSPKDELLVVVASWGTKGRRRAIKLGLEDVVAQVTSCDWRVAFWEAHSEPCLLVADYCSWALQRKHERGDARSYDLIKDKVSSEFKPFEKGNSWY